MLLPFIVSINDCNTLIITSDDENSFHLTQTFFFLTLAQIDKNITHESWLMTTDVNEKYPEHGKRARCLNNFGTQPSYYKWISNATQFNIKGVRIRDTLHYSTKNENSWYLLAAFVTRKKTLYLYVGITVPVCLLVHIMSNAVSWLITCTSLLFIQSSHISHFEKMLWHSSFQLHSHQFCRCLAKWYDSLETFCQLWGFS